MATCDVLRSLLIVPLDLDHAEEMRLAYETVPSSVRHSLERELGARIVDVRPTVGGFSPCLAAAAELDNDTTVFIKAVSSGHNPDSPSHLHRESDILDQLPVHLEAPELLATYDDGYWVALATTYFPAGMPQQPWTPDQLRTTINRLAEMNTTVAPTQFRNARQRLGEMFNGWKQLQKIDHNIEAWWTGEIQSLVDLETTAIEATSGQWLQHGDVRADNIVFDDHGRPHFVDWPHAFAGAPWVDLILWMPSLIIDGAGTPNEILEIAEDSQLPLPNHHELLTTVTALAGFFLDRSLQPDPPGLPTLRSFQAAQATTSLHWLKELIY